MVIGMYIKVNFEVSEFSDKKSLKIDNLFKYKLDKIGRKKKNEADKILNNYLNITYKKIEEYLKVDYKGINFHNGGNDSLVFNYNIKVPFMKEEFRVTIGYDTLKILSDNFCEVLLHDNKFQHLYSNWVKKHVGLEDENVELYFNRAMCGSRVIGDNIYIDFDKITDLNNLEEQLCENTNNIYIRSNHHEKGVDVKIYNINDVKEALNYADLIEKKIRPRIFIDTNHFMPSKSNHLFICFLTQSGENDIDIKYDYDNNTKLYRYHNRDSEWIEYE